jgi:signal peptidase II
MIVGGALGNVVDRLFRGSGGFFGGAVVDFIDFQWWPVFNIADVGVVCGSILLVISMWRAPINGAGGTDVAAGSSTGGSTGSTI